MRTTFYFSCRILFSTLQRSNIKLFNALKKVMLEIESKNKIFKKIMTFTINYYRQLDIWLGGG